jgi:hypothetical protein
MAQNFKLKDLTISIPEKGAAEPTGTACTCNTNIQQTNALAIHATTTIWTFTHITCAFTPTNCHINSTGCLNFTHNCTPVSITDHFKTGGDPGNEISSVTDVETLNTLKEKLAGALKEVEAQHAALSK